MLNNPQEIDLSNTFLNTILWVYLKCLHHCYVIKLIISFIHTYIYIDVDTTKWSLHLDTYVFKCKRKLGEQYNPIFLSMNYKYMLDVINKRILTLPIIVIIFYINLHAKHTTHLTGYKLTQSHLII